MTGFLFIFKTKNRLAINRVCESCHLKVTSDYGDVARGLFIL